MAVLCVAGGLAGCAGTASVPPTTTPPSTLPAPTTIASPTTAAIVGDVDVGGGRTLHVVCDGPPDAGRPTIVFENGAGPSLSTWSLVMNEVSAKHRACAYDRAGVGQSDAPPGQRTIRDQVADLAAALEGLGVTEQIVLVAHSRGGWNAIVYTAAHPEQVAGAVLVDVQPPGLDAAWLAELPPETPDEPAHIREARDIMSSHPNDPSMTVENLDIGASAQQALAAPGFGARPVEILWATETEATVWPSFDPGLAGRLNAAFEAQLLAVEALADHPNVTRVDTGHSIQEERPQVVVDAIRRVLAALEMPAT
jgi:pimeloyl-ACP methyl ester carboxylesterase